MLLKRFYLYHRQFHTIFYIFCNRHDEREEGKKEAKSGNHNNKSECGEREQLGGGYGDVYENDIA